MHYTYKFTTALAVIYTNCQVPTWHHRDLILLPLTQLMWDPGTEHGGRKGSLHQHSVLYFCRQLKGTQWRATQLTLRGRSCYPVDGCALCGQSLYIGPIRNFLSCRDSLHPRFHTFPRQPNPNTGWSPGYSLMNKHFNKHANLQLRVCFPANPTWDNSLVQNPSRSSLDAVFLFNSPHFCLCCATHLECHSPVIHQSKSHPFVQDQFQCPISADIPYSHLLLALRSQSPLYY